MITLVLNGMIKVIMNGIDNGIIMAGKMFFCGPGHYHVPCNVVI